MQSLRKYYLQNFRLDNSRCYKRRVSLASNNEFTEVFQAIVSVLHSFHLLHSIAITVGRDFASSRAGCSFQ